METPTTRERNILKQLSTKYWEDTGSVCPGRFGKICRSEMLAKGWIEFDANLPSGRNRVRMTSLGAEALQMPAPRKANTGPKLKMLRPMLQEANFGIGAVKLRKK